MVVTGILVVEGTNDVIIANNEDKVAQYKGGKEKMFAFFVGQTMKASKGTANPAVVNKLLKQRLS